MSFFLREKLGELDVDTDQIKEYADLILEMIMSDGEPDFSYLDELFEKGVKLGEEEDAYILDHNADELNDIWLDQMAVLFPETEDMTESE